MFVKWWIGVNSWVVSRAAEQDTTGAGVAVRRVSPELVVVRGLHKTPAAAH